MPTPNLPKKKRSEFVPSILRQFEPRPSKAQCLRPPTGGSMSKIEICVITVPRIITWIPCKLVIPSRFISWKTHFLMLAESGILPNMTPESIHTKDESKRGFAFAFIFGVNWPVQWMQSVITLIIFWQNALPANIRKWVHSWNKTWRNDKFHGRHVSLLCVR